MDSLLESALAKSTQAAYSRVWVKFLEFDNLFKLDTNLPLSTDTILYYIRYLHISPILSAISYKHKILDLKDHCKSLTVSQILAPIKRNSSNKVTNNITITSKMMNAIYLLGLSDFDSTLYKAMLALQFYFAL